MEHKKDSHPKAEKGEGEGVHQKEAQNPKDAKKDEKEIIIESQSKKIEELNDRCLRLAAEFDNHKKRTERDAKEFGKVANASLIEKLLPLLDAFDEAIKADSSDAAKLRKGIELLNTQLRSVLKGEGIVPIDCLGKKFDPHFHDVMMKEPSEKEEGVVLAEFQKGYLLNGKILRHSKVKVAGK